MRREFTALPPEFDTFLCAQVEDTHPEHGMSTSVMSALSRSGLDPWKEAARLALLPRQAAVRSLASVLSRLGNVSDGSDAQAAATRLVELLPDPVRVAAPAREDAATGGMDWGASKWIVLAVIIVAAAIAMHLYS